MEFEFGRIFVRGNFIERMDLVEFVTQFPQSGLKDLSKYFWVHKKRLTENGKIRVLVAWCFAVKEFQKLNDAEKKKYGVPDTFTRKELRPLLWRIYNYTGRKFVKELINDLCL